MQCDEIDEGLERVSARAHGLRHRRRRIVRGPRTEPVGLVVDDVPAACMLDDEVDEAPQETLDLRRRLRHAALTVPSERVGVAVVAEQCTEASTIEPAHRKAELELDEPRVRIGESESGFHAGCAAGVRAWRCAPLRRDGFPEAQRPSALDHRARDGPPFRGDPEFLERCAADFLDGRLLRTRVGRQVEAFEDSVQAGTGNRSSRKRERASLAPRLCAVGVHQFVLVGRGLRALVVVRPIDIGVGLTGARQTVIAGRPGDPGGERREACQTPYSPQGPRGFESREHRTRRLRRRQRADRSRLRIELDHRDRARMASRKCVDLREPLRCAQRLEPTGHVLQGGDGARRIRCAGTVLRRVAVRFRANGFRLRFVGGGVPPVRALPFGVRSAPRPVMLRLRRRDGSMEQPCERRVLRAVYLPPRDDAPESGARDRYVEET